MKIVHQKSTKGDPNGKHLGGTRVYGKGVLDSGMRHQNKIQKFKNEVTGAKRLNIEVENDDDNPPTSNDAMGGEGCRVEEKRLYEEVIPKAKSRPPIVGETMGKG